MVRTVESPEMLIEINDRETLVIQMGFFPLWWVSNSSSSVTMVTGGPLTSQRDKLGIITDFNMPPSLSYITDSGCVGHGINVTSYRTYGYYYYYYDYYYYYYDDYYWGGLLKFPIGCVDSSLPLSADTPSCQTQLTGSRSTGPTVRSPPWPCWIASPCSSKTTCTRPLS